MGAPASNCALKYIAVLLLSCRTSSSSEDLTWFTSRTPANANAKANTSVAPMVTRTRTERHRGRSAIRGPVLDDPVARATDGLDGRGPEGLVDLAPEIADVDVDHVRVARIVR